MEAGQASAGGLGDVGQSTRGFRGTGRVRGRWLALVAGVVIVAFGGAFAVGAATSTKRVAPPRLAPAVGSAKPAALKLAVKSSVSVPGLVRVAKPKPKRKPAKAAGAPAVAAVVATPHKTPVVVTHTGGGQSAPATTSAPAAPTVRATHPTSSGSKPGTKPTSTSSGTGTVSGSG